MQIILFFLSIIIAILFFVFSVKFHIHWVKKSFIVYGFIFMITALSIGGMIVYENRASIIQVYNSIGQTKEYKPQTMDISEYKIKHSVQLDAPQINQLPELPRGCEVTSLAMLLEYHDIKVDKMELAEEVVKDSTPYEEKEDSIYFGDPYQGFVGNMYTFSKPGYGVYHGPIAKLAEAYVEEGRVHDFSGGTFGEVIDHLNNNRPVWVIINSTYDKLPESYFKTWNTPNGPIEVTQKEHSVLITGYDEKYIYFNDPLQKESKAPYEEFKAAWVQMGKQAITIYPS